MVDTFNFEYNKAYTASVEFQTIVDEKFTGSEQRRDIWTNPRRKWVLEFDKNKVDREDLVDFFIAQKGRKNSFKWTWAADKGGDDVEYTVRFNSDSINLDVMELGYSNFKLELVEVFDNA